ncbi:MAG: hypothetical protein EBR91_03485 [Flavobacteriia bacterium]|jgi:hypothetical protein|nr:hypothetical protein [Flavobacteriia bacterium]NBV68115.1 hypothetical protein [Flavobacteriia bacterium]NBV91212.1 hypothetical protein [Flavobacteriia bacterium]NBY40495.1 hypothetical protein [Flavobacteriia bacterium]
MTTYNENLRTKGLRQAKLKLSEHRERGSGSDLNVLQVADLMDKIRSWSTETEANNSIFFSVNLN